MKTLEADSLLKGAVSVSNQLSEDDTNEKHPKLNAEDSNADVLPCQNGSDDCMKLNTCHVLLHRLPTTSDTVDDSVPIDARSTSDGMASQSERIDVEAALSQHSLPKRAANSSENGLESELISTTPYLYKCSLCDKVMSRRAHIVRHFRIHTGERPYQCDTCEKAFTDRSNFQRHKVRCRGTSTMGENALGWAAVSQCYKIIQGNGTEVTEPGQHLDNLKGDTTSTPGSASDGQSWCFVDSSFGQSLLDTSAEHSADENSARIAQIYGAGRQHKCFYCNAIMASPSEMKRHVRVHTGEKPYQCSGCDAAFARSYDLYRHERRRHHIVHSWWNQTKQTGNSTHIVANEQVLAASSNVQEYTHRIVEDVEAKSESQVFPSGGEPAGSMGHTDLDNSNTIDVDRQQIRGQQFVCFYCNLEVSSAAQLKIHTRVHTGEKPYPCNLCESSFARSYDLKRHKRLRHKIFMPLTNTAKEKRSKKKHAGSPDDILNHTAGAKVPASDPHDETEGHSEEYIRVNGVKQECCVDDAFGQSSQPFVDNDSRSYTPGAKRSGKEKRYKCFYCDMMATCPSQLAIHMRVHTGEKPYQCNLCDTAFARSYDLYRHKRIRHKVFFSWTGKIRNRSVKQSTMLQLRGAHQISRPKFSAVTRQNVAEIAEVLEDTVGLTGMKLECSGDDDDDIFNHGAREQNADRRIKNRRSHGLQSYIRKRRYKCFYCNTLVSSPSQLTIHTRVHTGEKPYRCNLCDTAFARSYDLHRHKRNSHEFSRSLPSASVGIKRRRSTTKRSSMLLLEGENLPLEAQVLTSDQGNVADVVADLSETSIGFIETKPEGYGGDNAFDQGSCDQTINLQTERLTPGLKKSYIRTRRYKCFHCNTPMSSPSQLTIHLRVHTGEKPYQCTQCDTAFARSYDLRRHLRNSHNVSVSWNIRQNRRRSTNHSRDFQLENPSSQRKLTLPASTQQPIAEVEDISEDTVGFNVAITESLNEKTCYQGPTLDQVIDLQDIGLQKKSHTRAVKKYIRKRRYKCFYCEKTVTCPSQLTIHLRVHTGEKPYQCTHCDTAFARSFDLYRHMRNSHSLPVSWTSIKRSRNVKRSDVLQLSSAHLLPEVEVAAADQHLTNVEEILSSVGFNEVNVKRRDGDGSFHQDPGEQNVDLLKKKSVRGVKKYIRKRRYKCFYCEKTVTCPSQLTIHLRVHTGEKPYQCTHCDAAFARSFDLYRHMRNSHSLPVSWTSIKRSRNVKRSPLLQLLEGEDLSSEAIALTSDQKLVAEMEDVSEDTVGFSETTFECTDGDVVFDTGSFQQNFDRPKKKRSNSVQGFTRENMYKCFYCEKTVSCPSQLAIHLRVHTGEKPYQCELCDLPFARSSDLSRHERNSHKLFLPRTSKKRSKSTDEQIQVLQLENASLSSGEMLSASNQQHVEDVEDVSIDCHTELRVVGDQRPSVQQNVVRKRKPVRNAKPYVRQRRYECPFCNRMMTSPSELTRHTRIHTGEKPYPCNQCEAAFARAHDLFRHRRSCHKLPVKKSKSANNPVS